MRVALHSHLLPGRELDYDRLHSGIPDALLEAHLRVGIHDWAIWRSGRSLFHIVDCKDFGQALRLLDMEPANQDWQLHIRPLISHFERTHERLELPLVWRMSEQR